MSNELLINELNNLSKHFSVETIDMTMSSIYHDFSVENYDQYKKHRSEIHNTFKQFMSHLNAFFSLALIETDTSELKKQFSPYLEKLELEMSEYEAFLKFPNETLNMTKDLFSYLSKIEGLRNFEKFDFSTLNEDFIKCLKHGIAAISFEAFSCEALINETLLKFTSKNQLDKKQKSKSYKSKFESVIELLKIEDDYSDLYESLEGLMRSRNEIAHFKGIRYDLVSLVITHLHNDENQDELFYFGEAFKILDNRITVYERLNELISKSKE